MPPPPSRPASPWSGADLPPAVRRLGGASFFQDFASEMVYPLLPAFLASFGAGPALLGAMESGAEAVLALVKRQAGRASDRWGRRKPFVVFGYAASALARPLLALAVSAGQVVALRLWDRLAKGVRTAPRDALIADATPPERRAAAFAFHRGLDHLGAAVGPLAAGIWLAADPGATRALFAAATLPALAGVAIVALGLPREQRQAPAASAAPPASGPAPRRFQRALAAFFLFALARSSEAFLLLRAGELGAAPAALAAGWALLHVLRWLASAPAGRWADRVGRRPALAAGWSLHALAWAGFGFAPGLASLTALLPLFALSTGLVEGSERALAVELGDRGRAGAALGAYHAVTGVGAALSSLAFGALWQATSARVAFTTAALAAVAAAALLPGTGEAAGA